ncbi:methyltransferase [Paraburkholderia sp. 2C]|jgi:O-methyltransferase/methyltransferase family protein
MDSQNNQRQKEFFGTHENAHSKMLEMIVGYMKSQVVRATAFYSLAEHLDNGVVTPEDIAAVESLHPVATFRLMRACAALGMLTYDRQTKTFGSTQLLRTLRKDDPASLRSSALLQTSASHWLPWGRICESVASGEPQIESTLGHDFWTHLEASPEEAENFTDAMRRASSFFDGEVGKLIDMRSVRTVVDVGGASGSFVQALMEANPELQGAVFDLPSVVPAAERAAHERGMDARFSTKGGDFFTDPLPGADMYLLKMIMHDWNDEACLTILRNCRRYINDGGRLIVAEMVVGEPGDAGYAPLTDLLMMVALGGKERSIGEFEQLFADSGFRLTSTTPTSTPFVLVEAEAIS